MLTGLPYFADWLGLSGGNYRLFRRLAYTIFETMNDRGLSGHLLANITDADLRNAASSVWRDCVTELQNIGNEEDADALRGWLRSQHARTNVDVARNLSTST